MALAIIPPLLSMVSGSGGIRGRLDLFLSSEYNASRNLPLTFLDSYELVRVKKSKGQRGT